MGRPFASPFASTSASGATPSCSQAKKLPVRPVPHCTSSKMSKAPCSSASTRAAARNSALAGWIPALALHGLDQDRSRVGADRSGERLGVVQPGEAGCRRQRLPRRPLRRLARDGERAVRAAVERAVERDDDRLARRLPRPLQRRLDRLRAGVAEERPRTAEASREQLGQPEHRLRRVEIGRVPEPVELLGAAASGAGWQWPSETTAIPPSRSRYLRPSASVSQTRSPDTKVTSWRAYAGSSAAGATALMPPPPSRRSRRNTVPGRADGSTQLRDDAAAELAGVQQSLGLVDLDRRRDGAAEEEARDVCDEQEPLRTETDGEGRRRLVGVDVERPRRERRDDGQEARAEHELDGRRTRRERRADEAELRDPHSFETDLVAEERHGERPDSRADRLVDGGERARGRPRAPRRSSRAGPRRTAPRDRPLELGRDLRAGAVDDADLVRGREAERERSRVARDRAADLEDDDPAHEPVRGS